MSWLTNIVSRNLSRLVILAVCAAISIGAAAQELRVPSSVTAGEEATIKSTGIGKAMFYLLGPGLSIKREVALGDEIRLPTDSLGRAGRYLAILCSDSCRNAQFTVSAARPASLAFLVHPSRVPVGLPDAVSGVAMLFDKYDNPVLRSTTVNFQVNGPKESLYSRSLTTRDGEAWFRTSSGKSAGPLRLTASAGDLSVQRVVQQVASEPCDLHIKAKNAPRGIDVETETVRDCAGNPVSDGTIITFTGTGSAGKMSIDAPIKGGAARVHMAVPEPIVISAACGVTLGNEVHLGEQR